MSDDFVVNLLITLSMLLFAAIGCIQLGRQRQIVAESRQDRLTRGCRDLPYIGVSLINLDDDCWAWNNDTLGDFLGTDPQMLSWDLFMSTLDTAERKRAEEVYLRFKRGDETHLHIEHPIYRLNDGAQRWIEVDLHPVTDIDGQRYLLAMTRDITEHRQALASLQRQRDLYETLSQTNKIIVRSRDPQAMLDEICTVAIKHAQLSHAWVGRIDDGKITPLAWSSEDLLSLQKVFEGLDQLDESTPTSTALREGRVSVCNDVTLSSWNASTQALAAAGKIASIAAFPLYQEGALVGNLTLYSSEKDFFDTLVLRTLAEIAGDIGYALGNIERQQKMATARQIIEASPVVVLRWSLHSRHRLLFASENILRWGYRAADLQDSSLMQLVAEADRARVESLIGTMAAGGEHLAQSRFRILTGEGEERWVEAQIISHRSAQEATYMEAVVRDVHARKQHEDRLNLAAAVFSSTREGVVITDGQQRIIEVNPAFTSLLGYTQDEVVGRTPHLFSSGRHDAEFYSAMWQALDRQGRWQGEIWNRRRDGQLIPELLSITRVDDPDGGERRYVGVFADITELKRSSERIDYLVHTDAVTELPNRTELLAMLDQALKIASRHSRAVALLILDLDHFKDINDSYGHGIGDELLKQVAARLRAHLRASDSLARLGGDEFAVLLTELARHIDAADIAQELIKLMSEPFRLSIGAEIQSGVSIGISVNTDGEAIDTQEMLKQADAALYRAKSLGRGSYSFYAKELSDRAAHRVEMEVRLRRAFAMEQLEVFYQPQVDIVSGRIIGAEALLRWHDSERGYIPPDQFIPLAEQSELIVKLANWVLEQVCRQGRAWLDQGYAPLRLAVNLSPNQLRNAELIEHIDATLKTTGFPAGQLELELTEGTLMHDPEQAAERLNQLCNLGISISLDDFGTGYSSLAYLKRFPLSVLKIDKSFTSGLPQDLEDCAISRTVVAMGHALGMSVLAEGVETEQQLAYLRDQGCDVYQGYLCSPAVPAQQFIELLASSQER
ncbi:EAL domain-containing protein [Marinobacterium sp. D7]|uniref:EAL domain-containing protein n=1 Tax=Marinobacterium ramblicola TaxID=2849041 RepID=UPI001C2D95E2|nr:EAL domain-containing protein [Marinobacterium ramblicola]MBV1788755.1 EAL domain-containing protein [Marinobacterium ramblicola]